MGNDSEGRNMKCIDCGFEMSKIITDLVFAKKDMQFCPICGVKI